MYTLLEMGDSIEAVPEGTPEPEAVAVVDFNDFCNYIRKIVTVLLPNVDTVPPALNAALQDRNNQDCIRKFISDQQVPVLFIQRTSTKGNGDVIAVAVEVKTHQRLSFRPYFILFLCEILVTRMMLFRLWRWINLTLLPPPLGM